MIAAPFANASGYLDVHTVEQLRRAVAAANRSGGNLTIRLSPGIYTLRDTLDIEVPRISIAGESGQRSRTIIQGDAMSATARVGNLIRVAARDFELHDVTLQRSRYHLIQIAGERRADAPVIRDCVLRDAYEQMIKVSLDPKRPDATSNGGIVEHCTFEYTAGIGPQYYIGGIDAHGARHWIIRDNLFRNITSPSGRISEFAVHFWDGSADNIVERNHIINCDRGIGFGLGRSANSGGIIRNNMIYHAAGIGRFGDVGIALSASPGSQVYNNTIYFDDAYPRAIEFRLASTTGVLIANNLTNRMIAMLGGATGRLSSNDTGARSAWFVDAQAGDLHLAAAIPAVIRAGKAVTGLTDDFDSEPRPKNEPPDLGADQFERIAVPLASETAPPDVARSPPEKAAPIGSGIRSTPANKPNVDSAATADAG